MRSVTALRTRLVECVSKRLLLSQDHYRTFGRWIDKEPDYPHSTAIVVQSFDAEPDKIQNIVRRELQKRE